MEAFFWKVVNFGMKMQIEISNLPFQNLFQLCNRRQFYFSIILAQKNYLPTFQGSEDVCITFKNFHWSFWVYIHVWIYRIDGFTQSIQDRSAAKYTAKLFTRNEFLLFVFRIIYCAVWQTMWNKASSIMFNYISGRWLMNLILLPRNWMQLNGILFHYNKFT